jgi:hypothetical protein
MPAGTEGRYGGELLAPLDSLLWQGFDENAPEIAAQHLGAAAGAVIGFLKQHRAMPVEHARSLTALVDEGAERVCEARHRERVLAAFLVDIEHSALRAGFSRGLGLVDRSRYAVDVEDACEGEAAKAGANDGDLVPLMLLRKVIGMMFHLC